MNSWNISVCIGARLRAGKPRTSGSIPDRGMGYFSFCETPKSALQFTWWVLWVLSARVNDLHLFGSFEMRGAVLPFRRVPSWRS